MPNIISSPVHSFVDFNDPVLYCGDEAPFPLPAPAGVGFQVYVTDSASDASVYYLGICDEDCNLLNRYNSVSGSLLCSTYQWTNVYGGAASWPASDKYPILVNTCYGYDNFMGEIPYSYATEADLLEAISDSLGFVVNSFDDFDNCCPLPINLCLLIQDIDNAFYGNILNPENITVGFSAATVDITPYVDNGNCFRYCVTYYTGEGAVETLACSQLFVRDDQDCYRTTLKYYGDDNQFGFSYRNSFYNMVRIPMYLRKPIFPIDERVYRTSSGTYRRQSAIVEKEWEVWTDYLPEWMHQRLVIALKHDHVLVTSPDADLTEEELTQLGEYGIEWQEKEDVYAPATYKIRQPVDGMNRNCNTQSLCCTPTAISFEYGNEVAGTGDIFFGYGANTTFVQVRYKLNTSEEWITRDAEAVASPLAFDYLPVTICQETYWEVQMRSLCGTNYSAWSGTEIVRHPLACGYPVVASIDIETTYAGGPGVASSIISISLSNNDEAISFTYNILNADPISIGSGTTPSNIIYSNAIIGAALDSANTFTITRNCSDSSCTITGTITVDTSTRTVVSWTTAEV